MVRTIRFIGNWRLDRGTSRDTEGSVRMNAITASASSRAIRAKLSYGINGKRGVPSFETPDVMARNTSPSVHVPMAAGVMLGAYQRADVETERHTAVAFTLAHLRRRILRPVALAVAVGASRNMPAEVRTPGDALRRSRHFYGRWRRHPRYAANKYATAPVATIATVTPSQTARRMLLRIRSFMGPPEADAKA